MTPQRDFVYLLCPPALQITTGSDVYSFGVLMWSFYTGQQPYVWAAGMLRPNTLFPHFPTAAAPQYKSLAERCLQRDPHQRPTFAEISDSLVAFFSEEMDGPGTAPAGPARPAPPTLHNVEVLATATSTPADATAMNAPISNSNLVNGPYGSSVTCVDYSRSYAVRSQLVSCLLSRQLPSPQQQQQLEAPEEGLAAVAAGLLGQGR